MPLGLPEVAAALLAQGPTTNLEVHRPDGSRSLMGWQERQQHLDELTGHVRSFVAQGPFWPGENLVPPPAQTPTMPYQPDGT